MGIRLVLALALPVLLAAPAKANERFLGAKLKAELGSESAVSLTYELEIGAGTDALPIQLLNIAPVANVQAEWNSEALPLTLGGRAPDGDDARRAGSVRLPEHIPRERPIQLVFRYRVDSEELLPLLLVAIPPAPSQPALFVAEIRAPHDSLAESFPASFEHMEGGGYRFELPVLPAFLRLRWAGIEAPRLVAAPRVRAGFVFWGLFAVFGGVVVLYLAWMYWADQRESAPGA